MLICCAKYYLDFAQMQCSKKINVKNVQTQLCTIFQDSEPKVYCRGCWPQPQRLLLIEAAVASLFWPLSVNNSSLLLLCFTLHRRVLLLKRVRVRLAWKAKVDENFFNFTHFYNLLAQKIGQLLLLLEILMSETFFQPFTHLFLFLYLAPGSFYKRGLLGVV